MVFQMTQASASGLRATQAPAMLAKAALSHLELALRSLTAHVDSMDDADRQLLANYATYLGELGKDVCTESTALPVEGPTIATLTKDSRPIAKLVPLQPARGEPTIISPDLDLGAKDITSPQQVALVSPHEEVNPTVSGALCQEGDEHAPLTMPETLRQTTETLPKVAETVETSGVIVTVPEYLRMKDIFDQLDQNGDGTIDKAELRQVCLILGVPAAHIQTLVSGLDSSMDGKIDFGEWVTMMEKMKNGSAALAVDRFMAALVEKQAKNGRIYAIEQSMPHTWTMLSPHSKARLSWDILLALLLGYVALATPFNMAFGETEFSQTAGDVIDGFFLFDIILNFRTAVVDESGFVVYDGCVTAKLYIKTWFFLDLMSSLPLQHLAVGGLPDFQAAKLLRFGKAAKGLKMLRLGKVLRVVRVGAFVDWMEEQTSSLRNQCVVKLIATLVMSFIVCHWLACFMVCSGSMWLEGYANVDTNSVSRMYLAAMYWAMTTITTVGYGDITPYSDGERGYAMIAMVIGGTVYAYVVGSVASIFTASDLNSHAYNERMCLVQAWLNFHAEFPGELRRKIRRHFKDLLTRKAALDDNVVLNDLSPDLRADVAVFLVHEDVRYNPLFTGVPANVFSRLMLFTEQLDAVEEETIVEKGTVGCGMYIIVEGCAVLSGASQYKHGSGANDLGDGDSFGEETLLGLESVYQYTVVAKSKIAMHFIPVGQFTHAFQCIPDIVTKMHENFAGSGGIHAGGVEASLLEMKNNKRPSLAACGAAGIPPGFTQVVLDSLTDIAAALQDLNQGVAKSSRSDAMEGVAGRLGSLTRRLERSCADWSASAVSLQSRPNGTLGGSRPLSGDILL